jgi:hypothetical protein
MSLRLMARATLAATLAIAAAGCGGSSKSASSAPATVDIRLPSDDQVTDISALGTS